jgi:hypothetical protein
MRSLFLNALAVLLGLIVPGVHAQQQSPVEIERLDFGSGEPEQRGFENATAVLNDVYHAPQYLPGLPTAASIWPRVVEVPCTRAPSGTLQCKGYQWLPTYGRAEYLYFRPVVAAAPVALAPEISPAPAATLPARAMSEPPAAEPAKPAMASRRRRDRQ